MFTCIRTVIFIGAPSLTLTTNPYSMGSFCSRPVSIICTGSEISFTFVWKNGSDDLASYSYHNDHIFPRSMSIMVPLGNITFEINNATSVIHQKVDIVSTLIVPNIIVLDGYLIYCKDALNLRSRELHISAQHQGTYLYVG